jgi:predicted RNA methylase
MADFVQKTVNKTAVRDLAVPIADVTSFNNLIETVIEDNPFGCVGYTGSDGQPVAAVVRNREHYTAKVDFISETTGKRVGNVSLQSPSIAAFNANAAEALANAAFAARCSDWSGAGAP